MKCWDSRTTGIITKNFNLFHPFYINKCRLGLQSEHWDQTKGYHPIKYHFFVPQQLPLLFEPLFCFVLSLLFFDCPTHSTRCMVSLPVYQNRDWVRRDKCCATWRQGEGEEAATVRQRVWDSVWRSPLFLLGSCWIKESLFLGAQR